MCDNFEKQSVKQIVSSIKSSAIKQQQKEYKFLNPCEHCGLGITVSNLTRYRRNCRDGRQCLTRQKTSQVRRRNIFLCKIYLIFSNFLLLKSFPPNAKNILLNYLIKLKDSNAHMKFHNFTKISCCKKVFLFQLNKQGYMTHSSQT